VKSAALALGATLLAGVVSVTTVPSVSSAATPVPPVSTFTLSSFNVLGSSHTPPGGRRAPGTTRIVWANRLLDRHHVDVVGFQELQAPQYTKFMEITAGSWDVYPGLQLRRLDSDNSIGWRTDRFELVYATHFDIPYFDGNPRTMPLVLLRDKATGMLAWFANVHNPSRKSNAHWRRVAERYEAALQVQLYGTRLPRFFTGDLNDREVAFCNVVRNAPLKAARGGSLRDGVCDADRPRAVDWIFGAKKVRFSNYVEDRGTLVAKTTDHPVIVTDVAVPSSRFPASLGPVPAPFTDLVTYRRR
jgi:hypothetical protein